MKEGEEARKQSIEMTLGDLPKKVIKALYQGIYQLDESSRAQVLKKAGRACARGIRAMRTESGLEYPTGVDLDTACEFYTRAALSDERLQREFTCKRYGDTVEIRDAICGDLGSCCCILVLAGFIEPNDSLCRYCQEGFWEENFKYMTWEQLEKMDAPESHTMGGRNCVAVCHFKKAK